MPLAAGKGGGRSREAGVATARGPFGPEDGQNREAEIVPCRSWAVTDTEAREPGLTLGPSAGKEARLLCLAALRSAPIYSGQAGLSRGRLRPGLPRERRCCLRLKALGTVAAVGEAFPGRSQCRIIVFLFPRLTWPLRRMHGDGRPSSSLGFLALDDHRGAVGSGPKPWAPPAAPGLVPWTLTPVGPCGLQRARLSGPEPNPAAATAPADLWKCRCPRPPHLCCHIPKLRPGAESFEIASQLASAPLAPRGPLRSGQAAPAFAQSGR